jgi:MinD-like ATPase involved in chromosome partitioning or flagellar assembly
MTHSADESDDFDQPEALPRQPPAYANDDPSYFAPPPPYQPSYAPPPPLAPQPLAPQPGDSGGEQQPDSPEAPSGPRHYSPAPFEPPRAMPPMQSYQPPAQPEPQPAPIPRPEDLLVPNQSPVTAEPASWGWRGRVNRASGGLIKPKAGPEEIAARRAIHEIQRGFSRPMTVVVVQPKGGAGKTPTTICLSAAFGAHRGGYVVGWDDNETRGTLAVRVSNPDDQRATVWDLLGDLGAFERFDARVGDLSYYVRPQPDAHFDALVSDDNPGNMAQIGEDEFHRLHKVLQRFYRMIVVDTGNNVRSPNWQAAVNAADLVVVVSTYQRDVGYSGSWVLDHLAQTGREELARNAVTVLTAADPTTDRTVRDQLLSHFRARTRAVVEIPYDTEIAHGGPIRWSQLADNTRTSWIHAGATVVSALVEQDQRTLAARRS